jgi:hypothetical protein
MSQEQRKKKSFSQFVLVSGDSRYHFGNCFVKNFWNNGPNPKGFFCVRLIGKNPSERFQPDKFPLQPSQGFSSLQYRRKHYSFLSVSVSPANLKNI